MREQVLLEEMTWRAIREALDNGKDTVLVMVGAIEQHGPHLPTGTDTMLGYERGIRLAKALGNALIAPVIRPGRSDHHMHFPGTITLSPETFKAMVIEFCVSLGQHGFKNMVLIPTHGGNYGAMEEVLPKIQETLPGVNVILIGREDSKAAHARIQPQLNVDPLRAGVHSGLAETALMLASRPELVHMEHAQEGWLGEFDDEAGKRLAEGGTHAFSSIGVLGDARGATVELGEAYLNEWTDIYAKLIRERLGK
jgi:creatinine amidohydrolase